MFQGFLRIIGGFLLHDNSPRFILKSTVWFQANRTQTVQLLHANMCYVYYRENLKSRYDRYDYVTVDNNVNHYSKNFQRSSFLDYRRDSLISWFLPLHFTAAVTVHRLPNVEFSPTWETKQTQQQWFLT